jgi:hypothetical protein
LESEKTGCVVLSGSYLDSIDDTDENMRMKIRIVQIETLKNGNMICDGSNT